MRTRVARNLRAVACQDTDCGALFRDVSDLIVSSSNTTRIIVMISRFRGRRRDAGRRLAAELRDHARRSDVLVLALPRGGVRVLDPDLIRVLLENANGDRYATA